MTLAHGPRHVEIWAGHLKMQPYVKAAGGVSRLLRGRQRDPQPHRIGADAFDGLGPLADDRLYGV
jgi:hypothetical protein